MTAKCKTKMHLTVCGNCVDCDIEYYFTPSSTANEDIDLEIFAVSLDGIDMAPFMSDEEMEVVAQSLYDEFYEES